MKVFNLRCEAQHVFEGWFGSEADYASQLERGLLTCPLCGSSSVSKMLSAPRLNLGASSPPDADPAPQPQPVAGGDAGKTLQAAWLQATRQIMAQTEDVGARFAEEARKIHYGESEERGIRGQATPQETAALLDEGIGVMPLALPSALKGPIQ
jgi:hypothetical protein